MKKFLEILEGAFLSNQGYRLRYLPIFYEDLEHSVLYIAEKLQNVQAANELLDEVETAILERLLIAESFEPYYSPKERRYPYYCIYIKNYIVYYVVIDDEFEGKIMEVRRFLHKRQNRKKII